MNQISKNSKFRALQKLDSVKIGYARVSSLDDRQKLGLEVQTEAMAGCSIIFSEKQSGSNDNRAELDKAINWIGYTRLDRKNKMCTIIKNILEEKTCQNVKEEPILMNLNNKSSLYTMPESLAQKLSSNMN